MNFKEITNNEIELFKKGIFSNADLIKLSTNFQLSIEDNNIELAVNPKSIILVSIYLDEENRNKGILNSVLESMKQLAYTRNIDEIIVSNILTDTMKEILLEKSFEEYTDGFFTSMRLKL